MEAARLFESRENLKEKLKKLEVMKPQIREAVYAKIKDEYEKELAAIEDKLGKERESLLKEIERVREKETELLSSLDELDMKREELNVRFTLNEYSQEDFDEKKRLLETEADGVKSEIGRLREQRRNFENLAGVKEEKREEPKEEPVTEEKDEPASMQEEPSLSESVSDGVPIELQSFDSVIPESAAIPPSEQSPDNFKEMTIEESLPDAKESRLDKIISADILKDETFSLGEDVKKEEKLVNENPLESARGQKDDDLSDFAKMLDNQIEPLGLAPGEQTPGNIEGLTCPKCGHINKSDLFNCEKCGSELL